MYIEKCEWQVQRYNEERLCCLHVLHNFQIFTKLGWYHCARFHQDWLSVKFPPGYRLFQIQLTDFLCLLLLMCIMLYRQLPHPEMCPRHCYVLRSLIRLLIVFLFFLFLSLFLNIFITLNTLRSFLQTKSQPFSLDRSQLRSVFSKMHAMFDNIYVCP